MKYNMLWSEFKHVCFPEALYLLLGNIGRICEDFGLIITVLGSSTNV